MRLTIVLASYDSGHHRSGFGLGPEALIAAGLADHLRAHGHDVRRSRISARSAMRRSARSPPALRSARRSRQGSFGVRRRTVPDRACRQLPDAAGAVAGDGADSIVWFDQHGDINTPETSSFGFLDGMALSSVLGLCWRPMTAAIPGFQAIDPARCVLVDARDLDPGERLLLDQLPISHVSCEPGRRAGDDADGKRRHPDASASRSRRARPVHAARQQIRDTGRSEPRSRSGKPCAASRGRCRLPA